MSISYIHYGHREYHPEFVDLNMKSTNPLRSKPPTGLWASREDAEYGWIDWCRDQAWYGDEEFGFGNFITCFKFKLSDDANILEIHCEDDILPYIISMNRYLCRLETTGTGDTIDFETIRRSGYDGLELFLSDDYSMHDRVFSSWDCDSIVVWNPNVIVPSKDKIRPEMWKNLDDYTYDALCNGCNNYNELPAIVRSVYEYMKTRKDNYTPERALDYALQILKQTGQSFQEDIQDYQEKEIIDKMNSILY